MASLNLDPKYVEAVESVSKKLDAWNGVIGKFGSIERAMNAVPEEDVLKFYYCESRDQYLIGKRADNFYYAEITPTCDFSYHMSRYLPWGRHIIAPATSWKEHTYPSEPVELHFSEWLRGLMKQQGWEWKDET